jgi:hypothetical protein
VGNYILLEVGLFLNYQAVRPRRVFRGKLKEAPQPPYPESITPLDERRGGPWLGSWPIIFPEHPDFQCTFWHVETVMKKVAVVLRHSKKPLPPAKKKPAVERYDLDRQVC